MRLWFTSRKASYLLGSAALVLSLAVAPQSAQADKLDDQLLAQMPKVIKACQEHGYKNVGVLTFQYQHADKKPQFRGAAINSTMPVRVENALALRLSSRSPELTLLPQASTVAAKEISGASYRTAADRLRLLDVKLTPAWGTATKVKPDALLFGKVTTSKDLRTTTVSLNAFDREKMVKLAEFDVKSDRSLLGEIGQGFSLSKNKSKVRGFTDDAVFSGVAEDIDKDEKAEQEKPVENTKPEETTKPEEEKKNDNVAENVDPNPNKGFPVELKVFYNDKPQEMARDTESSGSNNFALDEPQEGDNLTFGLKNLSDKPVGVVLLVNGSSTLYEQEGDPASLNKWVLEPGKEYRIKGYHQQGNNKFLKITTLSEADSKQKFEDLGGQLFAGLIHVHVFQSVEAELLATSEFTRGIGRLPRGEREAAKFASLGEFQQAIMKKSDLFPPGTRPLAGAGKEDNETLAEKKLGKTILTDTMIVRYSKLKP